MKKVKYIVLGAFMLLVLALDKQEYPRVEYSLNENGGYDVICKEDSTMLYHVSSFLIGTTRRDKQAYDEYCS